MVSFASYIDLSNELVQLLIVFIALIPLFYRLHPNDQEYEKQKLRSSLLSISSSPKSRSANDSVKNRDINVSSVHSLDCYGPKLVIFSGGTAFNSVVKVLSKSLSTKVTYVLPVSDNGGSSKEIIRVLGGPAIGDIRSRLVRLANDTTYESRAIKLVLEYRLNSHDKSAAKEEMISIVDGSHPIWACTGGGIEPAISEAYKETVRAFLAHFFDATLRRSTNSDREMMGTRTKGSEAASALGNIYNNGSSEFDYRGGAIGNFVFTGARLFFRSLDAAIFWFSSLSSIPRSSLVAPVINTNSRVTIGALLLNGNCLIGQDVISHPPPSIAATKELKSKSVPSRIDKVRAGTVALPSPIKKIYYVNQYGNEVVPSANVNVLKALSECEAIIYAMGSLYTSIIPSLIVPGIGAKIKAANCPKILILNGTEDRETYGMKVSDYVQAIVKAAIQSDEGSSNESQPAVSGVTAKRGFPSRSTGTFARNTSGSSVDNDLILKYVTDVLYIDSDEIISKIVTRDGLKMLSDIGIKVHAVPSAEAESVEDFLSGGFGVIDSLAIINDDDEDDDNESVITSITSTDASEIEGYTAKGKGVDFELLKRFEEQSRNFVLPESEETNSKATKKSKGLWGSIVHNIFGSSEGVTKSSDESESRSKHLEFLDMAVSHITGDEKEKRLVQMKQQLKKVMNRQYHKLELIETIKYILACTNISREPNVNENDQFYEIEQSYEQTDAFDEDYQYHINSQNPRQPGMRPSEEIRRKTPSSPQRNQHQQSQYHQPKYPQQHYPQQHYPQQQYPQQQYPQQQNHEPQYPQQQYQQQYPQQQYPQQQYQQQQYQHPSQQQQYGQSQPQATLGSASRQSSGRKQPSWGRPSR